eukprot:3113782-Amphidinium_carterae.1
MSISGGESKRPTRKLPAPEQSSGHNHDWAFVQNLGLMSGHLEATGYDLRPTCIFLVRDRHWLFGAVSCQMFLARDLLCTSFGSWY